MSDKDYIRLLSSFWVRLWNEHSAWTMEKVSDKTYAITGRLFLQAIRGYMEDLGVFDLDKADFSAVCSECDRELDIKDES